MKVVYCIIDSSRTGGMERVICEKANYLAKHGCDVTIITTDRGCKKNFFKFSEKIKFIDLGINYSELDVLPIIKKINTQLIKRKEHKRLLNNILLDIRPDICISTYTHELTLLHDIKDGSKKIAEIHFCKQNKWLEIKNNDKSFLSKLFLIVGDWRKQFCLKKYDAFVVLTENDKKRWKNISGIEVIPNPLPYGVVNKRSVDSKKVISVGRLVVQKGFQYLIEAWKIVAKNYPDWKLTIFGEGELKEELYQQIQQYQIEENVEILPFNNNIKEKYLESSFYVMSSIYEGFPMVLLEAMACGLPCISFDCPYGPSDIILEGKDGFLVKEKDVSALADKIIYLIEHKEKRNSMSINASINIERYLPENVMPKWIELFKKVLNNG